jgi:predicted N-formylglutamate amidohydrolase
MTAAWQDIAGAHDSAFLLVADHASNFVPVGIDLGIAEELLSLHIAVDLGVAQFATYLCARLNCPGILGGISRLVVDFNREEDAPHLVPVASDGHAIPGNAISHEQRKVRLERFWKPYHTHIAEQLSIQRPRMIISLHSFTPQLQTTPDVERPWEIGILYNRDERAARIAIPALEAAGVIVGDQLPYSGVMLNATMNRHGEENGIAYLGIEMRQDLIADPKGIERWGEILLPVIELCEATVTGGKAGL